MKKLTTSKRQESPRSFSYVAHLDENNNRTGYTKYIDGQKSTEYTMPEYLKLGISQRKRKTLHKYTKKSKRVNDGRTLASILKPTFDGFPVQGQDGYGGEIDGSYVKFIGVYQFPSKEIAQKIKIGKAIGIHWANYLKSIGWRVSLAYWSDANKNDMWIDIDENAKKYIDFSGG